MSDGRYRPPGYVRVRVTNPAAHWDPAVAHGESRYEHQMDDAGNTYVIVPREVAQLLHTRVDGYELAEG